MGSNERQGTSVGELGGYTDVGWRVREAEASVEGQGGTQDYGGGRDAEEGAWGGVGQGRAGGRVRVLRVTEHCD